MQRAIKLLLASASFCLLITSVHAAPIVLDASTQCSMNNQSNGIAISDVTGNVGGASDCWGAFTGNDPGPSGDGFDIDGIIFDFIAKQNTPGALEGDDIGLSVSPSGGALSGSWEFDPLLYTPDAFLVVLKAANDPGYAVWLFEGADAASFFGDWSVAWGRDLSHLAIYGGERRIIVSSPATLLLIGIALVSAGFARSGTRSRKR